MGSNFLQMLYKDMGIAFYYRNNHKPYIRALRNLYIVHFHYMQVMCTQGKKHKQIDENSHMIQQPPDNKEEENC